MLNNATLLTMYKQEKADSVDVFNDEFPSFAEWKQNYMKEYNDSHQDSSYVDFDVAIQLTDSEITMNVDEEDM